MYRHCVCMWVCICLFVCLYLCLCSILLNHSPLADLDLLALFILTRGAISKTYYHHHHIYTQSSPTLRVSSKVIDVTTTITASITTTSFASICMIATLFIHVAQWLISNWKSLFIVNCMDHTVLVHRTVTEFSVVNVWNYIFFLWVHCFISARSGCFWCDTWLWTLCTVQCAVVNVTMFIDSCECWLQNLKANFHHFQHWSD